MLLRKYSNPFVIRRVGTATVRMIKSRYACAAVQTPPEKDAGRHHDQQTKTQHQRARRIEKIPQGRASSHGSQSH